MTRIPPPSIVLAALFLLPAIVPAGRAGELSPLLDPVRDEVARTAVVPSTEDPHAQVRLIRRGNAAVMQTLIVSRLLKRVVGKIRKKESSRWPPGKRGHEDAARYVDALDRAYREAERRYREGGNRSDRRRKLLIELVLSENEALVAFLDPEIRGDFGAFRITERRVLEVLPLSHRYVRENLHEIAVDSLGWSRREAREALKPLLPPVLQPEEDRKEPIREGVAQ